MKSLLISSLLFLFSCGVQKSIPAETQKENDYSYRYFVNGQIQEANQEIEMREIEYDQR